MASQVTAKLVFNKLPQLSKELRERAGQVVRKTAADVEAEAKSSVPVDTGNLKSSIRAGALDGLNWQVGTNVEYAPYVEYGTHRMAARPYLSTAAEKARGAFEAAMTHLLD